MSIAQYNPLPPDIDGAEVEARAQVIAGAKCLPVEPGAKVEAGDRGNIGTVVKDSGATCLVRFVSPEGNTTEVELPKSQLTTLDGSRLDLAGESVKRIEPVGIGKLVDSYPDMRPSVIEGILRRGETANIIAAAKIGKSFLAGGLAWCIATGTPWLSHTVVEGRVLIIDNELHPETLASRLYRIATDMMIDVRECPNGIDVIALRGENIDIHAIQGRLADIKPGTYDLVILDALYRTIPAGTSENDNAAMMAIYNRLDFYAREWDCAVAVVHHASKGAQGDKSITDVGSGAGSISRAADTHLVIRPHESPELSVLECVTRSFKSPEPVSLRFEWPIWSAVAEAPEVKRTGRQSQEAQERADKAAAEAMFAKIPAPQKAIQQNKLFEQFDFGVSKSKRLIGKLVKEKRVRIVRKRKTGGQRTLVFYTRGECSSGSDSGSDSGTTDQNQVIPVPPM